jgi:hypothetical protein
MSGYSKRADKGSASDWDLDDLDGIAFPRPERRKDNLQFPVNPANGHESLLKIAQDADYF